VLPTDVKDITPNPPTAGCDSSAVLMALTITAYWLLFSASIIKYTIIDPSRSFSM
jgi:hypothetical protein